MFSKAIILLAFVVIAVESWSVEPEYQHAPQPYKFGYEVKDKNGDQYRQEEGDGAGGVKGSYGFTDDRGVKRQVDYVADKAGFRAQVRTNEPGTANQDPAAVKMISDAPYAGGAALGGLGYGGQGYGNAGYGIADGKGLGYAGVAEGRGNQGYVLGGLGSGGYGLGGTLGGLGYERYGY